MSDADFIPTRASIARGSKIADFQTVVFESHKSKKREHTEKRKHMEEASNDNAFNIKKAKHEIVKFGMSGLDSVKKEEVKMQLLINLGAKPPKNKYKNYKTLLSEKEREKKEIKAKSDLQRLGKNSVGKSTSKSKAYDRKKRKMKGGLLDVYGKATLKNVNTK